MNKTCYKQYDTRWAKLGYPKAPWFIKNCGCGEVSICNAIIDMAEYSGETPKTIRPYMVRFAESNGNGTYHYGIPEAMKHYGMTEVMEHATMSKLWAELRKGDRVAILLMGSRPAGSKDVQWTGSGHFVEVSKYKEKDGKHWLYVKDSASTSSLRTGWVTYEDNIRGACLKCWSGKLNTKESLVHKIGQACKAQAAWMKHAVYEWESKPTIEKSKKKGTCVTYVACVLQRLGYLKAGQYIWHDGRGYGDGKVYGTNKYMDVIYMHNKKLKSLKKKLKAGDIILLDDNKSGESGSGGHIFILSNKWSGNNPYIWDNVSAKKGKHTYDGNRKVLAIVRLKAR